MKAFPVLTCVAKMPKDAFAAVAASVAVLSLGAALAVAIAGNETSAAAGPCSKGAVSRLYFGQSTPDGFVSEAQWRAFVAESVIPRFAAGFTEMQANGHWRDDRGQTNEEETRIVEIAHDDSPPVQERIRAVAAEYRRRFAQQSVLVTRVPSVQCFESGI
jgi:hypothetical protein